MNLQQLTEFTLQVIILTFMLVGLFGMVIPIFPGVFVIWLSAAAYALLHALSKTMDIWDWILFGLITVLMVIGSLVDNVIMARKLRETGTPWISIAVGFVAAVVASIFLTPFAALVATPLALYLVEWYRLRDWREAFASTKGWLIGFSWSLAAMFGIGVLMIVLWLLWAWF